MEHSFRFLKPELAALWFLVPLFLGLRVWALTRARRRLSLLASPQTLWKIAPRRTTASTFASAVLLALGTGMVVLAAMRPQGDPVPVPVATKGRDLVFVLDVSRSMLAQDVRPSRLGRAVLAIQELIPHLEGDRVGLVVFAGNAALRCPLTLDYTFFRFALDRVGPDNVSLGGTSIGDALRVVADRVLKPEDATYQDVILISDGEDMESFAAEAAKELAVRGVRIHTVGVGSPDGAPIPDPDRPGSFITYQGQVVLSSLREDILRAVSSLTPGGTYLPARTGDLTLVPLYRDIISRQEERVVEAESRVQWREWFQVPLVVGILCLCGEALIRGRWNA